MLLHSISLSWYAACGDCIQTQGIGDASFDELTSPMCGTYVSMNQVDIGSNNGLSPIRCQATIWTNAGILLIGPLGTYFNEILIKIIPF